ncbi:hypothetical protein OIO90_005854 [Microbotryomycetes sp. JL221]|nr:hypothetical protein OIO90_005854 [Microbotryomycetes sp. JL221]
MSISISQTKLGIKPNLAPFGTGSPRRRTSTEGDQDVGGGNSTAVKRNLAFVDESVPLEHSRPISPRPRVSKSSTHNDNPFFGNTGAARDRLIRSTVSEQSSSGKVIASLQADLISVRASLDSARQQLRHSQRAVETVNRQNEDLRETKTRLLNEIESLKRSLDRRERMSQELLARARGAEASLAEARQAHKLSMSNFEPKVKSLEEEVRQANNLRVRSQSAQEAFNSSLSALSAGWKNDLAHVRTDLACQEQRYEEARSKLQSAKASRRDLQSELRAALADIARAVQQNGWVDLESSVDSGQMNHEPLQNAVAAGSSGT